MYMYVYVCVLYVLCVYVCVPCVCICMYEHICIYVLYCCVVCTCMCMYVYMCMYVCIALCHIMQPHSHVTLSTWKYRNQTHTSRCAHPSVVAHLNACRTPATSEHHARRPTPVARRCMYRAPHLPTHARHAARAHPHPPYGTGTAHNSQPTTLCNYYILYTKHISKLLPGKAYPYIFF